MKTNKIFLSVSALALTAIALTPGLVNAYQGDPSIQGPNCTPERHQAITQAFTNNDYQSWVNLMEGRGVTRRINQANFSQFAQMHQLRQEGKTDEADQLRTQLGLGLKNGSGKAQGQAYGKNR